MGKESKRECMLSCCGHVQLFASPWTVTCQASLSMGFSRQEYWRGLPCSLSGDLPDPGIELHLLNLLHWQADSIPLAPPGKTLTILESKSESEVAQSYLTLSDPMDHSLSGSSAHGIFQARVLEWSAIAFSRLLENMSQNSWVWLIAD